MEKTDSIKTNPNAIKTNAMKHSIEDSWGIRYKGQIERNIGILSIQEQDVLRSSKVAVLGVGGIGAPLLLNLCYAGCQNFVIADFDKVERSNLNRQPYIEKDIGKPKVEALAKKILDINPSCEIRKFLAVSQQNIDKILRGVDVIVLSLDGPVGSILVAREARNRDIPLVEGWATPLVFSW